MQYHTMWDCGLQEEALIDGTRVFVRKSLSFSIKSFPVDFGASQMAAYRAVLRLSRDHLLVVDGTPLPPRTHHPAGTVWKRRCAKIVEKLGANSDAISGSHAAGLFAREFK